MKDAVDNIPAFKEFESSLRAIYAYVSSSSKRKELLTQLQEDLDDDTFHMLKTRDVRWLSRARVIRNVRRSLPALLDFFFQEGYDTSVDGSLNVTSQIAASLFKQLTSIKWLSCLYLLANVLEKFATVSLAFQYTNLEVFDVEQKITALKATLTEYFICNGCTRGGLL